MKAVLLTGYGDVDQLQYGDAPDPRPGPGEVLVRVVSSSVNPIDYKFREGAMKDRMPLQFPAILGRDVAGTVVETGPSVDTFKPGDKVMGFVGKTYAQYLVAKADELSRVPEGLDLTDAGSLPLVLVTGAQLIEKGIKPSPGQTVLVTGAVGSVGRAAVYVAKSLGARVIAGIRGRQKAEAESLAADSVVALDDDAELQALAPFDALADTVDGELIAKLLPKWNRSGNFASVLGKPEAATRAGVDVITVWAQPDPKRLFALAEDVAAGKFRIPIAQKLPLSEIREAHRLAQSGAPGKIVLLAANS
jgi:NADPH:quinone reductase-like Zn-dependent oxidoreductase